MLAYFDTGGVSKGGTKAINGIIEETRRLGHGYRNFTNYRLRLLLAANGQRAYRRDRPATPRPPSAAKPVSVGLDTIADTDRRRARYLPSLS